MKMKTNLLQTIFLLSFFLGYSQSEKSYKIKTYSYDNNNNSTTYFNFSSEINIESLDLAPGEYTFIIRSNKDCKFYFDEKSNKIILTEKEIEYLNSSLAKIKIEYYVDDILLSDCIKANVVIPVKVSISN